MAQVLFSQAFDTYSKFRTLTDTDAAKKTAIQTTAFMGAEYAAYLAARTRIVGATIVMMPSTVLWMNQEAFLHKALSENVASFSVENERLGGLIKEFEVIGMDLKSLSREEREQLQSQMSQFHDLFQALTVTVRQQTEAAEASHKRLSSSVEIHTHKLTQAQMTLALVFEQVILTFRSVESAETDLPALREQVATLTRLAQAALGTTI